MPRINLIPEVLYRASDPIHWEIDNLPLKSILKRQELINLSLDNVLEDMRSAIGTQGSFSNRLSQSLKDDGGLKSLAVDEANHSIASHHDTDEYVRMSKVQSDKLDLIQEDATNLRFRITNENEEITEVSEGFVDLVPTAGIIPILSDDNKLSFRLSFTSEFTHRHYYGVDPVHQNQINPDYLNFWINSANSEIIQNSLRIFINGIRIFEDLQVYVPASNIAFPWSLMHYTVSEDNTSFSLNQRLSTSDVIKIDFDIALQ